ncbi:MAG: 50S ribosomal protein L35 [Deltaproteobacteria bacterium]|nr:50S ribosomal protein L35 [Deltaproteobacteria bacterium]
MPKLKTNKSAAKRFKVTKTRHLKRGHTHGSHLMTVKSGKRAMRIRKNEMVDAVDEPRLFKFQLPYAKKKR